MIATRLSDRVALGFQAKPVYSTRIVELDNGREKRNINWSKAKRIYSALYVNWTAAMFAELLAAFHACRGRAYSFLFKDWTDYKVELGSLGNTPGANSTPVQLVKVYAFGAESITRTITNPIAATVSVYQDNGSGVFVLKPGAADPLTGLFTPTTAWTAGRALKASFEFDVVVRFLNDELPSSWDNRNLINTTAELIEDFQ